MAIRLLNSVVSVFLAVLLIFGSTSKEYIHLFADHKDTVHIQHDHDGLTFENEHHHCTFLSFTLTPFINDAGAYFIDERPEYSISHIAERVVHLVPRAVPASRLRGPPSMA